MIKKIAVFEYTPYGDMACMAGFQIVSDRDRNGSDAVRVSEWQEVEFTPVDPASIVPEMVKKIDDQIEEIKNKALEECGKLQTKKAELLALTND